MWYFIAIVVIFVICLIGAGVTESNKKANQTPAQKRAADTAQYGPVNSSLVCPHCQASGGVRTKAVKKKQGISGAKATGAVLTAGFSVLATGLSKKGEMLQCHCSNCSVTWHIA